MRHQIFITAALLVATPLVAPLALAAQGATSPSDARKAFDPRAFGGTWDRYPPNASQRDPRAPAREASAAIPIPAAVPPPPLKPEFKTAWEAKRKKIADATARGEPIANAYTHCLPDGMPTMMIGMFPMEVLPTPGQITIIQEAYNQVRRIYLNDKLPAIEDAEPGFWGHSVGHWEGNTLVADTVGIKNYVLFQDVPHSANMRINERMTMLSPDHFENVVTVTDPQYLETPWSWKWIYQRRPNYKMYEYVCEENREYADPETGAQRMKTGPLK
ncbi:MAG: hypothetical protein ABI859_03520 [Pseudomonadota bacterium]